MIKLTISPHVNPDTRTFTKKSITIGSGKEPVDISFSDAELQPIHIKIHEEGSRLLITNVANDPFATLNDLPFGKKTLKDKDVLQIGHYNLFIEILKEPTLKNDALIESPKVIEPEPEPSSPDPLETALEKLIDTPHINESSRYEYTDDEKLSESIFAPVPYLPNQKADEEENKPDSPFTSSVENIEQGEELDLEALIREVEQFEKVDKDDKEEIAASLETSSKFVDFITPLRKEVKFDDEPDSSHKITEADVETPEYRKPFSSTFHVGEFDDECENWINDKADKPKSTQEEPEKPKFNFKFISTIALALFIIFGLVAGALYFNMSAKNEGEEIKAAQGVADVAMALKYAQIQHIKPHKKTWSDPEFIRNTLAHVIPHDYPSFVTLDMQGHLNKTSYSLRIYTSTDFSQFLVIAQPAPSLLQSLIPKTALVIDSKLMQLRKVADMKTLNRLLVNSNNLDNSNAVEVTNLVKKGELIPLTTLTLNRKVQDFSPPKALSLIRPGAENYIYNAPRYYQLGETVMKRAINLMEMNSSAHELSRLKQEMNMLTKMPDLVIYSADGILPALHIQKALATYATNARFMTAYLKFNSQGSIVGSHLIIDDENTHSPSDLRKSAQENTLNYPYKTPQIAVSETEPEKPKVIEVDLPSENKHPVQSRLIQLRKDREKALEPLKMAILTLLNEETMQPVIGFDEQLALSLQKFQEVDLDQKKQMAIAIIELSKENSTLPLSEFVSYLHEANLANGSKEIFKHIPKTDNEDAIYKSYLDSIQKTDNFVDLHLALSKVLSEITIITFSDIQFSQFVQNQIKNAAIDKVNELLISALPLPLALTFDDKQRNALQQVLSTTWFKDQSDQIYYLEEFEKNQNLQ